jgi:hypothetical protein
MALNVELEVLRSGHWHRGELLTEGDRIVADPKRAQKLIDAGIGKKVGVVSSESEPSVESPDGEGQTESVGSDA